MAPSKPTLVPYWTDGAPNKVAQPTAAAAAQGFTAGQPPPFEYVNWLFNQLGNWVGYLNEAQNSASMSTSLNDLMRLINGGRWSWALGSSTLTWSAPFNLAVPSVTDASNQAPAGSVTLADGQVAYVVANIPFSAQGDLTSGSNQILDLTYELGISVGQGVSGTGIPPGAVVTAINGTTVTLSDKATATAGKQAITFSGSGALQMAVATSATLVPGPNTIIIARRVGSSVYVGVNTSQMLLRDGESRLLLGTGYINTVSALAGMPLPARAPVYISQGGSDANVISAITSAGSAALTVGDSSGLYAGMGASGNGIPAGATIASVSGSAVTLSAAVTASASAVQVTFTRVPGFVYACDASIINGANRSGFVGFTVAPYAAGAQATCATGGILFGFSGLTLGATYYVDPSTPGGIALGKPSVVGQTIVPVGTALGNTVLSINSAGAAANTVVTSQLSWPNYSARNESEFASALAAATSGSGGVILLLNPMTLSATYTVPNGVIIQGRKAAGALSMLSGASLVMDDGSDLRDAYINGAVQNSTLVAMTGNAAIVRNCTFNATPNANVTCINVTGSANRIYNCTFRGVSGGSSSTGIAYTAGSRNIDDSTYIVS